MNAEKWLRDHNIDEAMRVFVDNMKNSGDHSFLWDLPEKGYAIVKVTQDEYGNIHMENFREALTECADLEYKRGFKDGKKFVEETTETPTIEETPRKKTTKKRSTATEIRKAAIS